MDNVYVVVRCINLKELEEEVSDYLRAGWHCAGGVAFDPETGLALQAVYRESSDE